MATNAPYNPFPPAPPPPAPAAASPQGNGLAVAGMVVGIVGLVLFWVPYVGGVVSLVGLVLGAVGIARANKVGRGKGMAIAGVACGLCGVIANIYTSYMVMSAFNHYVGKSRTVEARVHVNRIGRGVKMYFYENETLPPSAALMPGDGTGACDRPSKKWDAPAHEAWQADPGWKAIDFEVYDGTRFSFRWTKESETRGVIEAIGDIDCDGDKTTYAADVTVSEGNVTVVDRDPTPD